VVNQTGEEMTTQNEEILKHLKRFGSITPFSAFALCGTLSLASRINELKKQGHKIGKVPKTVKNRYGRKVTVNSYYIVRKCAK
jgi:hypothetical protein